MSRPLSENAQTVLAARYLGKDAQGEIIETPDQLFHRVARVVAAAEHPDQWAYWDQRFYTLLSDLDFLPNSPALGNAGRPLGMLSACFVISPEDSLESIFETIKRTALIHQAGGGTGHDFSGLRPRGSRVGSTQGEASGPVSFMRVFDAATESIRQGGQRRGAMMGTLRVDHPDLDEFLAAKSDMVSFQNFNISVLVTDAFMAALDGAAREPDAPDAHAYAVRYQDGPVCWRDARAVWQALITHAWRNGDPGVLFIDRARASKSNPVPDLLQLNTTNPCGEQFLYEYDVCNLGSINLAQHVTADAQVDWAKLERTTTDAVRFLDDVIDVNRYPLPEIAITARNLRRIGLGVMGWADMLYQLGIRYGSPTSFQLAEAVQAFVQQTADQASTTLATERGVFPWWEASIYGPAGTNQRLRNGARTTAAPTGTLSIIADCSGGIEPHFGLVIKRQHRLNRTDPTAFTTLFETNRFFEAAARVAGIWSPALAAYLLEGGVLAAWPDVPAALVEVFATAHDVTPEQHVRMAAAFQRHVDNSLSKTANFPHDATPADVDRVYRLAYQLGCKGVTMYRDGSRANQVLGHVKPAGGGVAVEPPPVLVYAHHPCPECENPMVKADGCWTCRPCSISLCG